MFTEWKSSWLYGKTVGPPNESESTDCTSLNRRKCVEYRVAIYEITVKTEEFGCNPWRIVEE
jgi:hypothetical protein